MLKNTYSPKVHSKLLIIGAILAVMAINFIFLLGAHRILGLIGSSALKVVGHHGIATGGTCDLVDDMGPY